MIFGHRGIVQVEVLAHLSYKIELSVDAIQAKSTHGEYPQSSLDDMFIRPFAGLKFDYRGSSF